MTGVCLAANLNMESLKSLYMNYFRGKSGERREERHVKQITTPISKQTKMHPLGYSC